MIKHLLLGYFAVLLFTACNAAIVLQPPADPEVTINWQSTGVNATTQKLQAVLQVTITGQQPVAVDFYLDGQPVGTDGTAPFEHGIEFPRQYQNGTLGGPHRIMVVVHAAPGREVLRELTLDTDAAFHTEYQKADDATEAFIVACVNKAKELVAMPTLPPPGQQKCEALLSTPLPRGVLEGEVSFFNSGGFTAAARAVTYSSFTYQSATNKYSYFKNW